MKVITPFLLALFFLAQSSAASVKVVWSSNKETDLLGYRVHWGLRSANYNWHSDVATCEYELTALNAGTRYFAAITALDFWGNESTLSQEVSFSIEGAEEIPVTELALSINYPNPFYSGQWTIFTYAVPQTSHLELALYNRLGQKVKALADDAVAQGSYQILWDGSDESGRPVASGIYFCILQADGKSLSRTLTFLK
jgi:hypothetical protein